MLFDTDEMFSAMEMSSDGFEPAVTSPITVVVEVQLKVAAVLHRAPAEDGQLPCTAAVATLADVTDVGGPSPLVDVAGSLLAVDSSLFRMYLLVCRSTLSCLHGYTHTHMKAKEAYNTCMAP